MGLIRERMAPAAHVLKRLPLVFEGAVILKLIVLPLVLQLLRLLGGLSERRLQRGAVLVVLRSGRLGLLRLLCKLRLLLLELTERQMTIQPVTSSLLA